MATVNRPEEVMSVQSQKEAPHLRPHGPVFRGSLTSVTRSGTGEQKVPPQVPERDQDLAGWGGGFILFIPANTKVVRR
jgi:hypothetical protein